MGLFADTVRGLERSAPEEPGEFVKGMRSGGNAAMGSLNNLAGAVGQKLGAEEFATGRFSAADQYNADAAATAPRVASMRDVGSIGDGWDYVKGLAGGIVPVGGAALLATGLTGGGAIPAIAAGTAATAPFEVGDVVGRMRERGQPIDLTRAVVGGVGSAAVQNVLPGVARARLGGTAGRLPGGALASIPEQAALAGGGELGKQQAAAPNEALDWAQAGEAAAAGAVMGAPIAGMQALGNNRAAISSAAGKVGGAVKNATQRVTQATGDAASRPGSAAKTVGDKATALGDKAMAAGGKVSDTAAEGADAALQQVKGMELSDALTGLYDDTEAKARDVLDRIAKRDDIIGDVRQFAGLQGEKLKQALLGDDNQRVEQVKAYAKELGDQHPAVRDWLTNVGAHGKQAAVATAKIAKAGKDDGMSALKRFADAASKRAGELAAAAKKDGAKKSEDDSGIRQALAEKLIPELLKARPDLADLVGDPEVATQLLRGFAPLIEDLANGRRPNSDTIARLIDLAGPAADRLIEVAHSVVGDSTDPAKTREFFSGLNQFTQVRDSSDSLVRTLRKNLSKGQERMTGAELRQEAELLSKWRDDKRPIDGPNADPVAVRLNYMVRKHLDSRYGAKSEAVLAALEKSRAKGSKRTEDEYNPRDITESDEVDTAALDDENPTGEASNTTTRTREIDEVRDNVRVFTNKGGLYPSPEVAKGKNGFDSDTVQAIKRVQKQNPDMEVTWRSAEELGPDHPAVRQQRRALIKQFTDEGHDQRTAEGMADKAMKDHGAVVAEGSKQETRINSEELKKVTLDAKKYGDSASRIDTNPGQPDNVIIDAVKLTEFMQRKLSRDYSEWDDKSPLHRKARMFMEGVAAIQEMIKAKADLENVGRKERNEPLIEPKAFDIPDSTVIDKQGTTWGDRIEDGKFIRGVKDLKVKGRNSEALRNDAKRIADKLAAREEELVGKIQEMNSQRVMGIDGKLRPFPFGSAEGKALWKAEQDLLRTRDKMKDAPGRIQSLRERADQAEMYELLDEAGQADGGYPRNSTIRGLIDEVGKDTPVGKLLSDYLTGREDPQSPTGMRTPDDMANADPFGQVHRTLSGKEFPGKDATIRSNMSGVEGRTNDLTNATRPAAPSRVAAQFADSAAVEDFRLNAGVKDRELRPMNARQLGLVGAAIERLNDAYGPQLARVKFMVQDGESAPPGSYSGEHGVIAIRADKLREATAEMKANGATTQKSILRVVAHELARAEDHTNGYLSERSKGLMPEGGAYEEAKAAMAKDKRLAAVYEKIFDGTRDDAKNARELYAQLNAMYHAYPELMREHQPKAYAVIDRNTLARAADYRAGADAREPVSDARGSTGRAGQPATEGAVGADQSGRRRPGALSPGERGSGTTPLEQPWSKTATQLGMFEDGSGPVGGPPNPKAVAAKKAALLERARSGDESLIEEVKQHTDAVGLQNAVIHLARKGDVMEANTARAIDAINARIGELVKSDPQQAYDMLKTDRSGGKKYSMDRSGYEMFQSSFGKNNWSRVSFPGKVGPVEDAQISTYRGTDGDIEMKVYDKGAYQDGHVLKYDVFKNDDGKWEVGIDGPEPGTPAFDKYRDKFDTLTVGESDPYGHVQGVGPEAHGYSKFKAGVFSRVENAKLLRTLRDHLLDLGVLPDEISFGRDTGGGVGTPYRTLTREQMLQFDKSNVDPNRQGPINRKEVGDYINRTLGNSVRMAWANLGHAGEFERVHGKGNVPTEDVIRLSVHAMNPLSTAYHESLHAFIQKLNDQKHGKIVDVLFKAGESAPVLNQLRAWMAERGMGEKALAQLKDPEERAAYMYQAWADGKLNVGDQTKTVLGKIADFIRSVLGIWSNDARALHIMEYFHSGDFAKNMANRDQVYKDLMVPGRNKAIETARKMAQPILELGENLGVAGAQRLRDTGIPALRELADQMKLHTVAEGDDPGFVPAARAERTRVMNKLAADLKDFSAESVQAALESLQQKSNDPIKAMTDQKARGDAFTAKVVVRKLLDDMYGYMTGAGVKVADLGVGKDYFPRQYDVSYISSHQQEFKNVLDRNGVKNADKVLSKIMVSEGAEFTTVVTDKPGMQHLKPRDLAFIPEAELAPFMRKNLTEILNGYVTQATRRAEWAKRFGDDGKGVNKLIAEAQRQGATPDDVDSAWKFVRAVDGTLGDTINPEARRLFGNMIVYQNVRLLPLMIFSSVVDPMGIMVRGGTMADSFAAFKRGVSEIPKNFKKNPQDDAATKFAASIGVIDDTTLVHTLGALYSQGMVGDTGRKINDTLFRYNLAEQFNTSMRVSATEAAMGFLARHADGTASPHSRRWLSELGLEPNELAVDANGRVKVAEADGLTPEQSAKVKAAVNRWVDGAVLRPDAADKPIWMSDPHWSLISHLKQFTYSFHETILKRVAHEYQNGNYTPAMALMSYVPMMIAADMAKGLIQGGGEEPEWKQNWGVGDYVAANVERAGLLGVGQFVVDMLRDAVRGGTGVGALAGPTVEQFAEAARMLGGRESFGQFVLKSMPANALYAGAVDVEPADPKFVD